MNAEAWHLLACRSRALVHQASLLMGVLTHPAQANDAKALSLIATQASASLDDLLEALATAPELAAHQRTIQRFDIALVAWRRSVAEASPLAGRYQTALLRWAAQVVTSCLHVEALSANESARVLVTRADLSGHQAPSPP